MKKVYMFSLDDDVPLSGNTGSDIREIAFWLHEELGKFNRQIICVDGDTDNNEMGLIRNDLFDIKSDGNYVYQFTSDYYNKDKRLYEPFVLNDLSFGFTVYDGSIDDGEMQVMLEETLKILKLNYKFNIDSMVYDDKNEKNRLIVIDKLLNKNEKIKKPVKSKVKVRVSSIIAMLGL